MKEPEGTPPPEAGHELRGVPPVAATPTAEDLLLSAAKGNQQAFADLYDLVGGQVYGLVRRVLRDPAMAEEVTQEILLEVWRLAPRFDPQKGSATSLILTMAHRRAVDRVRSEQSSRDRDERVGVRDMTRDYDVVSDEVESRFERRQVREALGQLTDLQREAVQLAYYGGYTQQEVADLLQTPLGTVKTRLRDGLIRLRDTMGVGR